MGRGTLTALHPAPHELTGPHSAGAHGKEARTAEPTVLTTVPAAHWIHNYTESRALFFPSLGDSPYGPGGALVFSGQHFHQQRLNGTLHRHVS